MVEGMVGAMEEATEDGAGAIGVDTVMASAVAMAFTEDLDMVGGVTLTGGTPTILTTVPTMVPTTVLITMEIMGNRRRLYKGLPLRQNRSNSNLPTGASVRTQKVTTPTLKIVGVAGWQWCRPVQMRSRHRN